LQQSGSGARRILFELFQHVDANEVALYIYRH
jgi:hypothetical protein